MAEALLTFYFVFFISQKHPMMLYFNQYSTESATGYGRGPL